MKMQSTFLYTLLFLSGCAIGPNYHLPPTKTPASFENNTEKSDDPSITSQVVTGSAQLARWWATFNDPILNDLIDKAIASNLDLKIAYARLEETRAARGIAVADLWPQVNATANYTRLQDSANVGFDRRISDLYQFGFDASWEIDIFGGKRRAREAAIADVQAAEEQRRDVLVTLLGDVAQTYIDLRGFQARLRVANDNIKAQTAAVQIAQARLNSGIASELDLSQAKALLSTTKAQIPVIETQLKASIYRLNVLVGQLPATRRIEFQKSEPIPTVPTSIATGLPSDLLRRRPDVRIAERELAAATARIGVAQGEFFPKISLLGSFGFAALEPENWVSSASQFWTLGPSLRWPIFAAGKIASQVKVENARQKQALARYEKAVLTALADTENSIVAFLNEQIHRQHLADAVTANRRALQIANKRYLNGVADFLNVVDAERSLYSAEDQWIQSERTVSVALVSLYKALGGGWEAPPGPVALPLPASQPIKN